MAVFTLETDYSCETGYPFDNSRQIGNSPAVLAAKSKYYENVMYYLKAAEAMY